MSSICPETGTRTCLICMPPRSQKVGDVLARSCKVSKTDFCTDLADTKSGLVAVPLPVPLAHD